MTVQGHTNGASGERESMQFKRRSLIAGAAAVAVGALAWKTAEPVAAGGSQGTALICGDGNTATLMTSLTPTNNPTIGLLVDNSNGGNNPIGRGIRGIGGVAVEGLGSAVGMAGTALSSGGIGAQGTANVTGGTGLIGAATSAGGSGVGVVGSGDAYGVQGNSTAAFGAGMYGISTGSSGIGVVGNGPFAGTSGGSNNIGVYGSGNGGASSVGVYGFAGAGIGVYGSSGGRHGVIGLTTAAAFGGVYGLTTTPGAAGIYGSTSTGGGNVNTAYAGYFDGNFVAVHGVKSAAVPHPDGSYRLLYCMESPESWFEDFGRGKLVGGKAEVTLDPDFAAVVHTDEYHVFLTEYDDHSNVYVTKQTASGFAVYAKGAAGASSAFSWRVVAKRKDIAAARMATFDLPKAKATIALPKPLNVPEPPKAPPVSSHR